MFPQIKKQLPSIYVPAIAIGAACKCKKLRRLMRQGGRHLLSCRSPRRRVGIRALYLDNGGHTAEAHVRVSWADANCGGVLRKCFITRWLDQISLIDVGTGKLYALPSDILSCALLDLPEGMGPPRVLARMLQLYVLCGSRPSLRVPEAPGQGWLDDPKRSHRLPRTPQL